jgi:hypothetical protein
VRDHGLRPGHVDVVCDAREDGLVVLSELYAEGWSVAVDGQESPRFGCSIGAAAFARSSIGEIARDADRDNGLVGRSK